MYLYFAGAEAWLDRLLDLGVRNQLMSYFYLRGSLKQRNHKGFHLLARMREAKEKGYRFFLDSGAFTYQVKQKQAGSTLPPARLYFEEYKSFVRQYGDVFDIIAEFDVDGHATDDNGKIITYEQVDGWTNELLELENVGRKILPVYHEHRGMRWLRDWLTDPSSPYIGFSSTAGLSGESGKYIALAHRFGKWIHGFGVTRVRTDLKLTPFDSVDSTTWLRADKYGGTCIFRNNKFIVLDHLHKKDRALYKNYFESWGLDFKKVMQDDLETMRAATIIAWRELSNYLERQWQMKGAKRPYLYEATQRGQFFEEHPLVTRKREEREVVIGGKGAS